MNIWYVDMLFLRKKKEKFTINKIVYLVEEIFYNSTVE